MKAIITIIVSAVLLFSNSSSIKAQKSPKHSNKKTTKMDFSKITNSQVKQALEALEDNNKEAWFALFTTNAKFTDDGRTMDFKSFFDNAFSKKEKFLTIEKIENNSKDITGNFYAGQWGTFKVFFKFHQNTDGKFHQLDIGQAK